MKVETIVLRQFDQHIGDGLTVTLEPGSETDCVQIRCEHELSPGQPALCYPLKPWEARQALVHPFAYAEAANGRRRRWYRARRKPNRHANARDFDY